jgi:hypothetical protein
VASFVIDHLVGKPQHRNESLNANIDTKVDPELDVFFRGHYRADG